MQQNSIQHLSGIATSDFRIFFGFTIVLWKSVHEWSTLKVCQRGSVPKSVHVRMFLVCHTNAHNLWVHTHRVIIIWWIFFVAWIFCIYNNWAVLTAFIQHQCLLLHYFGLPDMVSFSLWLVRWPAHTTSVLLVSLVVLAFKVTVKFATEVWFDSRCTFVRLAWKISVGVVGPELPISLDATNDIGSLRQMKSSAAICTMLDWITSQVKITSSPGHANCLPSSSILDESFTGGVEAHVPVHVAEHIKSHHNGNNVHIAFSWLLSVNMHTVPFPQFNFASGVRQAGYDPYTKVVILLAEG